MCKISGLNYMKSVFVLAHPSLKSRSRSLEPMSGLAMWSDQPEYIELLKSDRGLGFSILDYQVNKNNYLKIYYELFKKRYTFYYNIMNAGRTI